MNIIFESALFSSFNAKHPGVEVWPDRVEGGWDYYWIVSRFDEGNVRNLAYVRCRDGDLQRRTYDENGDDQWVSDQH